MRVLRVYCSSRPRSHAKPFSHIGKIALGINVNPTGVWEQVPRAAVVVNHLLVPAVATRRYNHAILGVNFVVIVIGIGENEP